LGDRGFAGDLPVGSKGFDCEISLGGKRIKAVKKTMSANPLTATAIQRIFFERSDIAAPLQEYYRQNSPLIEEL